MESSDFAAWYAAAVATAVLIWDIIKYRNSGPQITGEAFSGWESYGIEDTAGKRLAFVKLSNTGDRPTTLTSWGMYWYPAGVNLNDKSKRRPFIIKGGLGGMGKVPEKIAPGDVWTGLVLENNEFKEMSEEGTLVFGFGFSHSLEETIIKIKPNS
ncbi:hypothetical protein [Marinobacter adhaerens]|uniref:hypothetical protein n=1 Tax=Marinobacter adhaerens TaxID=1033846 RepID=UPI001E5B521E|nr:hypothetical protein [Marinobacter adhaerens]MCD1645731.1 hypothetical protein [Marinobacter adhaerens]